MGVGLWYPGGCIWTPVFCALSLFCWFLLRTLCLFHHLGYIELQITDNLSSSGMSHKEFIVHLTRQYGSGQSWDCFDVSKVFPCSASHPQWIVYPPMCASQSQDGHHGSGPYLLTWLCKARRQGRGDLAFSLKPSCVSSGREIFRSPPALQHILSQLSWAETEPHAYPRPVNLLARGNGISLDPLYSKYDPKELFPGLSTLQLGKIKIMLAR